MKVDPKPPDEAVESARKTRSIGDQVIRWGAVAGARDGHRRSGRAGRAGARPDLGRAARRPRHPERGDVRRLRRAPGARGRRVGRQPGARCLGRGDQPDPVTGEATPQDGQDAAGGPARAHEPPRAQGRRSSCQRAASSRGRTTRSPATTAQPLSWAEFRPAARSTPEEARAAATRRTRRSPARASSCACSRTRASAMVTRGGERVLEPLGVTVSFEAVVEGYRGERARRPVVAVPHRVREADRPRLAGESARAQLRAQSGHAAHRAGVLGPAAASGRVVVHPRDAVRPGWRADHASRHQAFPLISRSRGPDRDGHLICADARIRGRGAVRGRDRRPHAPARGDPVREPAGPPLRGLRRGARGRACLAGSRTAPHHAGDPARERRRRPPRALLPRALRRRAGAGTLAVRAARGWEPAVRTRHRGHEGRARGDDLRDGRAARPRRPGARRPQSRPG